MDEPTESRLVQSVVRALVMLEDIAARDSAPTATEVAEQAGLNRGTAWRLLTTLEHFDLVERDPLSHRYSVGFGALRIVAGSGLDSLRRRARPVLERLAGEIGECVYLQVASGSKLHVVDEVRGPQPVHVDLTNLDVPLHCGSVGKLFLGFLPEDELATYLGSPLQAYTERTITDPNVLRQEISQARTKRIAVAYQEHLPDWGGITATVHIRSDRPIAFLNVTVPTYRCSSAQLSSLAEPLRAAATDLEARLVTRG